MTLRERVIATAYTGIAFIQGDEIGAIGAFYNYASEKLGFPVLDLHLMTKEIWQLLKEKSKDDFVDMVSKKEGKNAPNREI